MEEGVRPAARTDLPELERLLTRQRAEQAGERGADLVQHRHPAPHLGPGLAADLDDPQRLLLVATIDDVVTGTASAGISILDDGRRLARIDDLYVEPEARAVGLGELLVGAVLPWATANGCIGVDAEVLPGARAAKNLFERLGFTARSITVHRRSDR